MANMFERKIKKNKKRIAGDVRQNQIINTFGIGSMVDFVKDTVIIAGIDDWVENEDQKIFNENLQSLTGKRYFIKPKTNDNASIFNKSLDIPSYIYPEKLYCPNCKMIFDAKELESRNNPHKCFVCGKNLVASRFVVVCENGHMEDFPYSWWVHKGSECQGKNKNPRIKMYNFDNRSDIESLMLECADCGAKRYMRAAFQERALSGEYGYKCSCNHPHLKEPLYYNRKGCNSTLRIRTRSSSSVYFPVIQSALSIPPWSRNTVKIINYKYDNEIKWAIQDRNDEQIKNYLREVILPQLPQNTTIGEVLKVIELVKEKNKSVEVRKERDIYQDEYIVLSKGNLEEGEFSSFVADTPEKYYNYFEKIVIVDRLTEIQALCGFTRVKPWDGKSLEDPRIAPLSIQTKEWMPAVQLNGEGIFIKFNNDKLKKWEKKVEDIYKLMFDNYEKSFMYNPKISTRYVMLHTFSHLFLRQLSNDCGYNIASLKEKIYSTYSDEETGNIDMCGVLIYLATPDSEGSLGGLISIAQDTEKLEKILDDMLNKALWCSSDPLCINSKDQGFDSLNYAACHDCTLLPETSCEFRNVLLDRGSIVGTIDNNDLGYFAEII